MPPYAVLAPQRASKAYGSEFTHTSGVPGAKIYNGLQVAHVELVALVHVTATLQLVIATQLVQIVFVVTPQAEEIYFPEAQTKQAVHTVFVFCVHALLT